MGMSPRRKPSEIVRVFYVSDPHDVALKPAFFGSTAGSQTLFRAAIVGYSRYQDPLSGWLMDAPNHI